MTRIVRWIVALGAVAALAACAGGSGPSAPAQSSGGGGYKIGTPYQIAGVWYEPVEDYSYEEVGMASWYGSEFDGRRTANGEVFDKDKVSAAHRTLPMPSVVEVTNLENGRSLTVRVNDRGPFAHGRIIDMSQRGAELLGFADEGTARVRVRVLAEESMALKRQATQFAGAPATQAASLPASPSIGVDSETLSPPQANGAPPPGGGPIVVASDPPEETVSSGTVESPSPEAVPAASADGAVFVQAGAFREEGNAARMSDSLRGYGPTRIVAADVSGTRYYRVQLGPLDSVESGNELVWTLRDAGVSGARIVTQ